MGVGIGPSDYGIPTPEKPKLFLHGHSGIVEAVVVSPDGRTLASGSRDRTIQLWDIPDGATKAILKGHRDTVEALAFSPDGRLLASGSWDNTIYLWDTNTGHPLAELQGHNSDVEALAFGKDGHILASGGADETIRLWATAASRRDQMAEVVEDINRDGNVDVIDLIFVASNFGKTFAQGAHPNPDVNRDGIVDRRDCHTSFWTRWRTPQTRLLRIRKCPPGILAYNLTLVD